VLPAVRVVHVSAIERLDEVERTPAMLIDDLTRLLRLSENRVGMLSRFVVEMAKEMGMEVPDFDDDEPRSTQALLLANDALQFWRS
jgi:hypothetical protein